MMYVADCPNNLVFQQCGSACNITCENKDSPPACIEICVRRCGCPRNFPILDKGRFVIKYSKNLLFSSKLHKRFGFKNFQRFDLQV